MLEIVEIRCFEIGGISAIHHCGCKRPNGNPFSKVRGLSAEGITTIEIVTTTKSSQGPVIVERQGYSLGIGNNGHFPGSSG